MKKGKKIGIAIIWISFLLIASMFVLFYFKDSKQKPIETKEKKEDQYTVLIKMGNNINTIEFSEIYFICGEQKKICSNKYSKITEYNVNKIFETEKNIDLKNQNIKQAIKTIYELGKEKKLKFTTLEIFSNYPFDEEELKTEIEKKTKFKENFKLDVTYQEKIPKINPSQKYYTISFDTNSSEKIANQFIVEGEKVPIPIPKKEGYTFVEWQLEDKKYDTETVINQDITLKAKWIKENAIETGMQEILNLNDDIQATLYHQKIEGNTFLMLATNLQEIFPNTKFLSPTVFCTELDTCLETDLTLEMLNQNINKIKIDTKNENMLSQVFKKYKNTVYPGIKNLTYSIKKHQIQYSFDYITIDEKIKTGQTMEQEINTLLENATLFSTEKIQPSSHSENIILTEEYCQEYNLNCIRS